MKELMLALMMWISAQTGYKINVPPPEVVFLSPAEVARVCIDEGTLVPYLAESCYKLHKHTIYLRRDFDYRDTYKVGVLVHELTHTMQLSNGRPYTLTTMRSLEDEANHLEDIYEKTRTLEARRQALESNLSMTTAKTQPEAQTQLSRPTALVKPRPDILGNGPQASTQVSSNQRSEPFEFPPLAPRSSTRSPSNFTASSFSVHLESYASPAEARKAAANLEKKLKARLGRQRVHVAMVDLGSKGIYYRVLAGQFHSKSEAAHLAHAMKMTERYAAVVPFK